MLKRVLIIALIISALSGLSVPLMAQGEDPMQPEDKQEPPPALEVTGTPFIAVLQMFASEYNISFVCSESVINKPVYFNVKKRIDSKDLPLDKFLDILMKTYGMHYEKINDVYLITEGGAAEEKKTEEKKEKILISKSYVITDTNRNFTDIINDFKTFVKEGERILFNKETRFIYVMATMESLKEIDKYYSELMKQKVIGPIQDTSTKPTDAQPGAQPEAEKKPLLTLVKKLIKLPIDYEQVQSDIERLLKSFQDEIDDANRKAAEEDPQIKKLNQEVRIVNESERLVLIIATENAFKLIEDYLKHIATSTNRLDESVPVPDREDTRIYTLKRPVKEVGVEIEKFKSPKGKVIYNEELNYLIIRDVTARFDIMERLIRELDSEPRQVLVEAVFMEVKVDNDLSFGIDTNWTKTIGSPNLKYGSPAGSISGYSLGFIKGTEWNVTLNALQSNTDTNILSRPKVIIANKKQANIKIGQEVPYMTTTTDGGTATQDVEFKDISLDMKVTPHIEPGERIRLEIEIVIKEQIGSVTMGDSATPIISDRSIKTEVFVQNGDTLIMGGLYEDKETQSVSEIPILGQLPILGNLFKSTTLSNKKTDLLFFITPQIVKPNTKSEIIRKGRVLDFYRHTKAMTPEWLDERKAKRLGK